MQRKMSGSFAMIPGHDASAGLAVASLKIWLGGAAVITATILVAALINQAGFWLSSIIFAVLGGLALWFLVGVLTRGESSPLLIVGTVGLVFTVAAALLAQEEVVLFGRKATDVVVADAPRAHGSLMRFRDARVLTEWADYAIVWAGSKGTHHESFHLWVAPIVGAGWTPDQPLTAFAVIGDPNFGHRRAEWRRPWNAGIALNGMNDDRRQHAAQLIARYRHVAIADGAVFVRWTSDPDAEAAAARQRLTLTMMIAAAVWSVLVTIGSGVDMVRRARNPLRRSARLRP